jgi:TRAP-type C4-dicarboxylate transport system substrate-binding protein
VKRIIPIMLVVLLIGAVILGCGGPAAETPTTPTTPTTEVKPIEWTFVSFVPPFDVFATQAIDWEKQLEEQSGGRLKVTFYWAESLVKISGLLDAVTSGTADMAQCVLAFYPERLSLSWVWYLPAIFDTPKQTGQALLEFFKKYPQIEEQYAPAKIAWIQVPNPFELVSKKPVQTMEDLQGLKISTGMKYEMTSYEALGAVPVPVHVTEMYQGLETGVVDAASLDFNAVFIWRLHEVTQYRIGNTLGIMSVFPTVISPDSYNKLPADVREIYDRVSDPLTYTNAASDAFVAFAAESLQQIKDYDKKVGNPDFYYLTPEEHQRWLDKVQPVKADWVQENTAKGFPAQAMLDELIALAAKYK